MIPTPMPKFGKVENYYLSYKIEFLDGALGLWTLCGYELHHALDGFNVVAAYNLCDAATFF